MNKTILNKRTDRIRENHIDHGMSSSSSIIARAGQIMALIIALGVLGMISSMLVSESLSGDAAQINRAGALRMQALRISRAMLLSEVTRPEITGSITSSLSQQFKTQVNKNALDLEIENFENRIIYLFEGGVTSTRSNEYIETQYQLVIARWKNIRKLKEQGIHTKDSTEVFDSFVLEIDELVSLLQRGSENKLSLLRLIQGISLFVLMLIAFVVLFRLNRSVIVPLKQIVTVAEKTGKGDFSVKADYDSDNELGVLARTINQMSKELELTHQDYEERVEQKTRALTRSNQSLQVLYKAASNLAGNENQYTDSHFLDELDEALGCGKVYIKRFNTGGSQQETLKTEKLLSELTETELISFPIEKPNLIFGILVWHYPKQTERKNWQVKMLQAMADIIATTIDLEERRNTEKRVLIFEERAVIARELHDSLAQSLSYLKVQMSLLTRKMQKQVSEDEINSTITDIKDGLNSAYRQLRELLTTFRLKLEDPSLSNAIQGTIVEFAEKCQHSIALVNELPENYLSANQEIHVLQIIREALSNVQRHSNATEAGVELKITGEQCSVEIWDNGVGLKQPNMSFGHFGLGIMQERAKSLDSIVEVIERQPSGTIIQLELKAQ